MKTRKHPSLAKRSGAGENTQAWPSEAGRTKTLFIDTTKGHNIEIAVKDGVKVLALKKIEAKYSQAEKLLPEIDKMLRSKKIKLSDLKEIRVANQGDSPGSTTGTSFTALRIGVTTANALGYALGIRVRGCKGLKGAKRNFDVTEPVYDKEPSITVKRRN